MPSRQQISTKKGPKLYLMSVPNLILVIFDDGRSSD